MTDRPSPRPFAAFEWWIAGRYLRARRQESFINVISGFSLAGIALGVATLIIVMSVMNGFRHELLGRILGLNGHFIIQPAGEVLTEFDALTDRLRRVPGVVRAAPLVEGQVLAQTDRAASGALVRGFRTADLRSLEAVARSLDDAALAAFDRGEGVIVGSRLAQRFGVGPGDSITLLAPRGAVTPFGTTPRVKRYTVVGTFAIGMSEYDSTFVFMPLAEAQAFFNLRDAVSAVEVMIADADAVKAFREPIIEAVAMPARMLDWQQINASFFTALQVERNVMFLILTLIILVAALNIVSGLIMLVKDKGRDIAILRTMGAGQGSILRVFFISGASIGVAGTLIGLVLGVVVCLNIEAIRQGVSWLTGTPLFSPEIYFLSQLPAKMEAGEVVAVVLMSLGLSCLATFYPAWRAARLDPVEALRYE